MLLFTYFRDRAVVFPDGPPEEAKLRVTWEAVSPAGKPLIVSVMLVVAGWPTVGVVYAETATLPRAPGQLPSSAVPNNRLRTNLRAKIMSASPQRAWFASVPRSTARDRLVPWSRATNLFLHQFLETRGRRNSIDARGIHKKCWAATHIEPLRFQQVI